MEKNTIRIGFSIPPEAKNQKKSGLQGCTKQKMFQARKHILFPSESSIPSSQDELATPDNCWQIHLSWQNQK